jgi:hypothetical protein
MYMLLPDVRSCPEQLGRKHSPRSVTRDLDGDIFGDQSFNDFRASMAPGLDIACSPELTG